MKETLIVRNLGPLKDLELELKPTMVFIGPQASGKSTLAKLIAIVRDDGFLASIDESLSSFTERSMALFQDYNIRNFFSEETYFSYSSVHYSIVCDKGHFNLEGPFNATETDEDIKRFLLGRGIKPSSEVLRLLSILKAKKIDNAIYSISIPAERLLVSLVAGAFFNLANNNVPIPKNILTFGAAFERARSELQELAIDFLDIVYKYENNQDRIYLEPGQSLKLTESSSGLQAAVPLVVTIEANYHQVTGTVFVIEEPELNLYPITQKELVNYLIAKCTSTSTPEGTNELVITTHSPYILSALSNCLFAYSVAQKRPDKHEAINTIVPQTSWLNPEHFNAYYVTNGQVENIFNPDTGVIRESMLDEASEVIGGEFYDLMDIYKEKV